MLTAMTQAVSKPRRRLLVALALAAAGSRAGAVPGTLRCTLAELPPFAMAAADGRVRGLYADLLQALAQALGMKLQLQMGPLSRAAHDLNLGASDISVMLPNAGLGAGVRSLGPAFTLQPVMQPRAGLSLRSVSDPPELHVVALAGASRWDLLPPGSSHRISYVSTPQAMVGMLRAQRADAALVVRETLRYGLQHWGMSGADLPPPLLLAPRTAEVWVRAGLDDGLARRLGDALQLLLAQGLPQQLLRRYGGA